MRNIKRNKKYWVLDSECRTSLLETDSFRRLVLALEKGFTEPVEVCYLSKVVGTVSYYKSFRNATIDLVKK